MRRGGPALAAGSTRRRASPPLGLRGASRRIAILAPTPADMGPHVKTTIELADPLLDEARRRAQRDGTPLRALVEQGLRPVIAPKRRGAAFRRRDASFAGDGLRPG